MLVDFALHTRAIDARKAWFTMPSLLALHAVTLSATNWAVLRTLVIVLALHTRQPFAVGSLLVLAIRILDTLKAIADQTHRCLRGAAAPVFGTL
jgi:hypothetical protein